MYKTKTQKKNALRAIRAKAMKLFASGVLSMKDAEAIDKIARTVMRRL
tara:strand:- start:118 stop:261 length:144 start_codon:yes stop_codon:yes gene_type:complete